MLYVSNDVLSRFETILNKREVAIVRHAEYKKWLRFFLDYCAKYPVSDSKSEQLRLFSEKLREKKQTDKQRQQARHAVFLYFEMLNLTEDQGQSTEDVAAPANPFQITVNMRKSQYSEAGYQEKSESPEWDMLLSKLADEIKVRHYSRNTLRTYATWSRQFQRFLKNKPPQDLSTADVKEYLTYLAVKCKVAAST